MAKLSSQYTGLITAAAMISVSLLAHYALHLPAEHSYQYLLYVLFTAGVVWSLFNHRSTNPGKNSVKEYFTAGFKMFVIVALLMAAYTFVFFSFNTEFRDARIADNARLLLEQGNHLPSEIEENSRQLKKLFMPIMVSSAVFRYLILGAVIALIGAAFLNQKSQQQTS